MSDSTQEIREWSDRHGIYPADAAKVAFEDAATSQFARARLLADKAALVVALEKIADAGSAQKPDQDQVYWETLKANIPEDAEGIYSAMLAHWECAEIARAALAAAKEGAK